MYKGMYGTLKKVEKLYNIIVFYIWLEYISKDAKITEFL